jgi:hypothetical protein
MPAGNNGPLNLFGDFGIAGGQDAAPNHLQDDQMAINWYAEVDPGNSKEVIGLLGCGRRRSGIHEHDDGMANGLFRPSAACSWDVGASGQSRCDHWQYSG